MTNGDLPNVGIIGLGNQGSIHYKSLLELEKQNKINICGLCDINKTLKNESKKIYHDYKDLIRKELPDLIIVTTPNNTHKEIVLFALESGIDVIKEKPLATNYQDGLEIIQVAQKNKRLVITTQQRYYSPVLKTAKKAMEKLGKPKEVSYRFTVNDNKQSWYWDSLSGGGSWLNLGWHGIAILQWMLGNIEDVSLALNKGGMRKWQYDTDHSAFAHFKIAPDISGTIFVSCIYPKEELLKIVFENGAIYLNRNRLKIINNNKITRHYVNENKTLSPYILQYKKIIKSIKNRKYDMRNDLQILKAIDQGTLSIAKTRESGVINA